MRIGGAIVLLAVGAILAFAVTVNNSHGFNVNTIGVILMIAGGIWFLAELVVYGSHRREVVTPVAPVAPPPTTEYRY